MSQTSGEDRELARRVTSRWRGVPFPVIDVVVQAGWDDGSEEGGWAEGRQGYGEQVLITPGS